MSQTDEPRLNTPTERALYRDCAYYKGERDRYRKALEELRDKAAMNGNMDDGLWFERLTAILDNA